MVLDLTTKFGISSDEVKTAFVNDWGVAHIDAYMVKNVYYHILLLLLTLGLRKHNEQMQKDALMLILVKLWNGRRIKFIRYCNQDVMRYVVMHELAHQVHMDHSPAFWQTVSQLYGFGVERAKRWLNVHGAELHKYF